MNRNEQETANRVGVKPKTLANWRSLGRGPAFLKLGARVVYDDADVDAWLSKQRRTSTSDPGRADQSAA